MSIGTEVRIRIQDSSRFGNYNMRYYKLGEHNQQTGIRFASVKTKIPREAFLEWHRCDQLTRVPRTRQSKKKLFIFAL